VPARFLVVLVALAALVVAGCGGSSRMSKTAYDQKLQADGKAVEAAVTKISGNPSSLAQLAKEVDAAETAVTNAADDLDKAKPPSDADTDNTKIVAALRAIATQLEKLKKAAATGNPSAAQAAATAIRNSPEVKAAQAAIADLKKKGYKVGAIGT
jgi:hypothetical protein